MGKCSQYFVINCRWSISSKNCESLYCISLTYTILFINYASIKITNLKIYKKTTAGNGIVSVVEDAHQTVCLSVSLFSHCRGGCTWRKCLMTQWYCNRKSKPQEKGCSDVKFLLEPSCRLAMCCAQFCQGPRFSWEQNTVPECKPTHCLVFRG